MAMAMMRRTVAAELRKGIKSCMQQREVVGSYSSSSAGFSVLLENQSLVVNRTREFWSLGLGCWAQQQVRLASTEIVSHTNGDDRGLLRVLKAEIEHEDVAYYPPRILARGPPQPFTLTDTAGKPEVILRRSFGEEDIALTCVTQPSDFVGGGGGDSYNEEHEDQDPDEHRVVNVKVSVTKGADQPVLEFSCLCQPDSIAIEHVCYLESKDLKDTFYDGPEFSTLDESLQKQFERYLDARGINGELSNYLLDLLEDKEEREYIRWLRNIELFLKK
ncbi:unnamed protein product [Sphagnum jensenii]|uniref:Mitochondrial glycoprotein n=1 Tax=Sphagnum jensenii TaxID=128206 RepID=A0ABP0XB05_9BRYO